MQRVEEIPFESMRKLMTTVHKFGNKYRVITKGAPDVLIKRCTQIAGADFMSARAGTRPTPTCNRKK